MQQAVMAKLHSIASAGRRMGAAEGRAPKMKAKGLDVFYGDVHAVRSVDLEIFADDVTALIGRASCRERVLTDV